MTKRSITLITIIILVIALIGGTTYAAFTFSFNHDIDLTSECFDIIYTKGQDIGSNENKSTLSISDNYRGGLSTTLKIKNNGECGIASKGKGIIYLNTEDITTDELITSGVLSYQVLEEDFKELSTGTITSKGKVVICDSLEITTEEKGVTVYLWINSQKLNDDNVGAIINSTYKGYISVRAENR